MPEATRSRFLHLGLKWYSVVVKLLKKDLAEIYKCKLSHFWKAHSLVTSVHFWHHFCLDISQGTLLWVTSTQQTLQAATEPMFRQPLVLWGLFGFSNVLCHNNSSLSSPWIQIFVSHGCAHWAQFKGSVQCSGTFQGLQGLSKLWAVPPTAGTSGTGSRAITPQCAPGFPSGAQEEQGSCLGGKKGMRKEIKGKRRVPKRKDQEENEDWNWKFQLLESTTDIRSEPTTAFQHKAAQHGYNLGTLEAEGKKSFHFPKLTISHKW